MPFLIQDIDNISEIGGNYIGTIYFYVLLALYFVPVIIAMIRGKQNIIAIGALNLFLGCTIIGWIVALVWSLSKDNKQNVVINNHKTANSDEDELVKLERLKKLLDDGAITKEEFEKKKKKLLS